jgi:hypothetical protein
MLAPVPSGEVRVGRQISLSMQVESCQKLISSGKTLQVAMKIISKLILVSYIFVFPVYSKNQNDGGKYYGHYTSHSFDAHHGLAGVTR